MRLRELLGALILGVPAAIVAHTLLFGRSHQLGGSLHGLFIGAALAAAVGFVMFFTSLALNGARHVCGGSVLAARLSQSLPGLGPLTAATALWYVAIEAAEPHHAPASWLAIPFAIAGAACLSWFGARSAVRAIARIAVELYAPAFATRAPAYAPRRSEPKAIGTSSINARRRFARPPPVAMRRA